MSRIALVSLSLLVVHLLLPVSSLGQGQFRPLYLSGKVTFEDGTPPPENTVVELWCGGQREPQEHTNREGKFNFRVGGDQSRAITDSQRQIPGAAVGASGADRSFVSLTNCELQAALPGYTSSKIFLGRRSVFESSDVGTIILRSVAKGEGTFVSANTLSAPNDARKAFEKGKKEMDKKKPNPDKAAKELQKAVEIYPQFAAAWNLLGEARAARNDIDGAREAFTKAMESDPKFVPPCLSLALMELKRQRLGEAVKYTDHVIQLLPELAEAHFYRAVASMSQGDFATAEESIRIVQAGPEAGKFPRTHFMLGNILAQKGDIPNAAAEFRRYLQVEPSSNAAEAVRKQLSEWESAGLVK